MYEFALIGHPVKHSQSPLFFTEKFEKEAVAATYFVKDMPSLETLQDFLSQHPRLVGFNVTSPHKQTLLPYLDHLSKEASEVGAVNTVLLHRDTKKLILSGYNTDIEGFRQSLLPQLKQHHKKALILGTGGAAKAVACGLKKLHIDFLYVSRNAREGLLTYGEINRKMLEEFTLLINATPVGMGQLQALYPPIPYEALTKQHLCYDLIYAPSATLFLKRAAQQGAQVKNGLEMLHLQAEESWKIWKKELSNA